jgi:hypothetical protein
MRALWILFLSLAPLFLTPQVQASLKDLQKYSTKDFLISTAPTGCMPKGMKLDHEGEYLYLAEMCGKIDPVTKRRVPTASIYDMKTRSLTKTLITPVGIRDGILANTEVEFSLDGRWAFIARAEGDKNSEIFPDFGLLTVVNTKTQEIVKYIPTKGEGSKIITARPYAIGDMSAKQILYVANYFSDDISVIDASAIAEDGKLDGSAQFVGRIRLHTSFPNPNSKAYFIAPRGIAFTPDGKYALVLATETGSLIVVDAIHHLQIAELAPMNEATAGRPVNLRHIVISKDGRTAYLSHMRGNAVSRIDIDKLIAQVEKLPSRGSKATLPATTWDELLISFNTAQGKKSVLVLEDYPKDHPNFPNKKWDWAHPNTIVLDPLQNRYLFVSSRTTTTKDDSHVDPSIKGKIDVIDTLNGQVVFSLVGGAQPTALEISHDGGSLISGALIDARLYFYDLNKLLRIYEAPGNIF